MSNDTVPTSKGSTSSEAPAASRKPDAIAREIELTRAELADTIDAIADRISPKRAVSRGRQAVRAQVSSVTGRSSDEPTRVISLDEPPSTSTGSVAGSASMATMRSGAAAIDRRLLVAGAAAGAVVGVIVLRRKRS